MSSGRDAVVEIKFEQFRLKSNGSNGDNTHRRGLFGCALLVHLALLAALAGKRGARGGVKDRDASEFVLFNKPTVPL